MAVLSVLLGARIACQSIKIPLRRHSAQHVNNNVCVRQMSHQRTMPMLPSKHDHNKWTDNLHFFASLGIIPAVLIIVGSNLFVGQAKLVDIPDDYHPKCWEYYKNPISRFLARYCYSTPEKYYEMHLHVLYMEQETAKLRKLENKVRRLMGERGDYKGWYYMPFNDRRVYVARKDADETLRESGT